MAATPSQPSIAPTVAAAPPQPGVAPTMAATPNQGMPAAYPTIPPAPQAYTPYPVTNYGESAPPPPPVNPYSAYGAPQTSYNTPQQVQYNVPPQQVPYGAPTPMYVPLQPQQPKSNRNVIIGVITGIVVFLLIISGVTIASINASHNATNNFVNTLATQSAEAQATLASNLTAQPTTGNTNNSSSAPDPSQIDANASTMILSAQSSSGIDSSDLPLDSQASFTAGTTVYVTFKTAGNTGYIMSKWFLNGQDEADSNPVADTGGQTNGYFSHSFSASGNGVVGIYWCTQSDCSDAALAQIVNVTVS